MPIYIAMQEQEKHNKSYPRKLYDTVAWFYDTVIRHSCLALRHSYSPQLLGSTTQLLATVAWLYDTVIGQSCLALRQILGYTNTIDTIYHISLDIQYISRVFLASVLHQLSRQVGTHLTLLKNSWSIFFTQYSTEKRTRSLSNLLRW